MTKNILRSTLLLTTALLIVGCDQKTDDQIETPEINQSIDLNELLTRDLIPTTISGDYLAGQFAQGQSDWKNASDYFSDILKTNPSSANIQRRIMALDMGSGHYDKAVEMAKKISKSDGQDKALAQLIASLSLFKESKYAESLKEIEGYKDDALGVIILPLLRAWAGAAQGKVDIEAFKSSPSLLYQAVLISAYAQDKQAVSLLAKQYDFTKTSTPIFRLEDIADVFARFDEKNEAKEIYTALKNAIPQQATKYQAKLDSLDKNISTPSKTLETPQIALSNALFDMAQVLSNGYGDSARLFVHMSLYLNPDNELSLELMAQIAADYQLYDEATSYLSRIDTSKDTDKKNQVTRQIAQLKTLSNQPDEAIRILNELVTEYKNLDAQVQIGDIYRNQENYADALKAYNKAYDIIDNNITAEHWGLAFSRGMVNERLKNWEQAEKDLQTALLFEPDQPYILNYLGYSWADQGRNLDKAAEMIEKAVRLKPDDGAIVDSLGWIYFRMGQFDKAVSTLERAIALDPTEPEINDHLGDAYWRVGRKNEARFQWKRTISFAKDESMITTIQAKIENGLPDVNNDKK